MFSIPNPQAEAAAKGVHKQLIANAARHHIYHNAGSFPQVNLHSILINSSADAPQSPCISLSGLVYFVYSLIDHP